MTQTKTYGYNSKLGFKTVGFRRNGPAGPNNSNLRFVEKCYTYHGDYRTTVPALLAPTFDEKGKLNNVQIIRINPSDFTKDSQSKLKKQTLGPSNGYFCELNKKHNNGITYVAEGVETGMSILEAKPDARVIVTFGVSNFKNVKFSLLGKAVCFCLDNDGDATFKNKSINAALKEAKRQSKDVTYIRPKNKGDDLNDELIRGGKSAVLATIDRPYATKEFFSRYEKQVSNEAISKENHQLKVANSVHGNQLNQAKSILKQESSRVIDRTHYHSQNEKIHRIPNQETGERDL